MTQKNEFSETLDFFKKNEREQNRTVMHIFYFTPLAGVAMVLACLAHVFPAESMNEYIRMTIYLVVQSGIMTIFCSRNPEQPWLKYYIVFSSEAIIFLLTISKGFEPFIVYVVAPLLSCLYFNKRFCLLSSGVSYVGMLISVLIRAKTGNHMEEGISPFDWAVEYGIGLTLEYILNVSILYLMSLWHLDTLNSNLEAINTFQETQDELITGYSELIYQAHQTRKVNIKRCQAVVELLCEILKDHPDYPGLKNEDIVKAVLSAVPLHDIGLIGVPNAIVSKEGSFTEKEKKEYQKHVVYGEELIRKNFYMSENREFLKIARLSALHHHERWDGTGYPEKLVGPEIPVSARIIAAADELEHRVCGDNEHTPVSFEVALSQIQKLGGTILDPTIVEAMLSARLSLEQLYSMQIIDDLSV